MKEDAQMNFSIFNSRRRMTAVMLMLASGLSGCMGMPDGVKPIPMSGVEVKERFVARL